MKFKWTEDMTAKTISGSVIAAVGILFYFLLKNLGGVWSFIGKLFAILSPFVTGFVIAYLFKGPVSSLESFFNKFLFKKSKRQKSLNRGFAIAILMAFFILVVFLVIYSLVPQLIESVTRLARNADGYLKSLNDFLARISSRFNFEAVFIENLIGSSQDLFKKATEYIATNLPRLLDYSISLGSGISNFFIGFIISIYMLSGKERFSAQLKKTMYAVFKKSFVQRVLTVAKITDETFGKYLTGKILDCALLGTICFILMSIFGMEYALLISLIIAITNFIPFIGPIIGAVPSAFILLIVNPIKALWFIVMIIVLQQIEGNFLEPKIVGKSTGLSSFWVIFAIIIGGGLFGITGVILSVPAFSIVYIYTRRFIEDSLKKKNLSPKTSDYAE